MSAHVAQDNNQDPADCHVCGRHAIGIGIGFTSRNDIDPRFLCAECALIIEDIRRIKRMDAYELKARAGGMEAAGSYLESLGKTDLADFEEEEALIMVGKIWEGCATELRRLIRTEAPF